MIDKRHCPLFPRTGLAPRDDDGGCRWVAVRHADDHVHHRFDGFLRSLLAGGVRSVVGAISPVMDDVAYAFDLELYRGIGELDNPGIAYRTAVDALRRLDPNPAIWGNFHFFGDPRPWSVS